MPLRKRKEVLVPAPYNPLTERNLARAIREELERQGHHPLPPARFMGAGLYALYYTGSLPVYAGINDSACITPIYVGRAEAGKGSYGEVVEGRQTQNLYDRIRDHARSIGQAAVNLSVSDFRVRYLVTSDVHIVLGESGLLQAYRPVLWNTVVTGFGSNPAGADRQNGRSIWDTLHGGRSRAASLRPNRFYTSAECHDLVRSAIQMRLTGEPIPSQLQRSGRQPSWSADPQGSGATIHDPERYEDEPRPGDH